VHRCPALAPPMAKRTIGFLTGRDEEERADPTFKGRRSRVNQSSSAKRSKKDEQGNQGDLGEEYVCPLTLEFPLDPVMLADGRCYERSAIEEHIRRNGHDGVVKSPVTNLEINAQLIPALLVRNTLSRLIDQGVIKGERASAWKAATRKIADDRKHYERIKALAEKGDVRAMEDMAYAYERGEFGQAKDQDKAYYWFLRAGRMGNAGCMTRAAICHLNGTGVERDSFSGMCMVHEAAVMGSEHACTLIAMGHASGRWAKKKDEALAVYWYRRATTARVTDTPQECRERGRAYLAAHDSEERVVGAMLGAYNEADGDSDP
jgi:hypothetical protein